MLDSIILFSIRNKLVVGIGSLLLVIWGGYSVTQLPIDAVPDITNNQVQILTVAPSQAAQDIERLVTFPVEQSIATIPYIEEVRSFSRFGLSVVTVVFKDNIDVYWARQQIAERLMNAKDVIPPEIGTPTLAPISTGLGEIYQYCIKPKPGYESRYSVTDLRTVQDWIVRRQLLGVPGVADVGSFGGKLKQYEVALDPHKLKSMNITITEVLSALQFNNQNTGGAYIDKYPNAYYIRSEGLVTRTTQIEQIAVKNNASGIPILIRDVGTVQEGFAIRYGAMTYDTTGEVVGAVVMMLKGANSSEVIQQVKNRISQIEQTLPEGLTIEPFLDRTKLVTNAIETVVKNLAEGALIVVFMLVLFLGNMRAGLVVASVIPLAMLFAISMMNVFGVSGNLMSLGAIDFGLIVDGAVIMVEATLHHLGLRGTATLSQKQMDEEVYESAGKIRNAAAFGELIILIVYLPILALVGVEGKMFKPMAQTVSFAIIGAFILSLTYVPMMSALVLSKNIRPHQNFSDKMMLKIQQFYNPILQYVLRNTKQMIAGALASFVAALLLFGQLGAEFIPALDEGDFAIDTRVLLGSSLSATTEATTNSAGVLLSNFPDEVEKVVSKIGSSEIPTDPMPIEAADLMVILKDKSEWTQAKTTSELADKMSEALKAVPGVTHGIQQPIQMRFNELASGARQDVVIKVFGEDLSKLKQYAEQIGAIAHQVDGAKDVYVEKMSGLPQIVIEYKRDQLAKYGISVASINQVVNAAFAGQQAGKLYDGEKRFDIVVRLDEQQRQTIDDVRNLFVLAPSGIQIPITELADVQFVTGPNQIQREDAKRRIMIGFNVRGKDVETVVNEIQTAIQKQVVFDPGYFVQYGGMFKNLEEARKRLLIAVPAALILILLLLYFTFHSLKLGLVIFTAIPLSSIGGILALWLRGMPFSISAGIGFIALFGVAVLNGIVLIAAFNRLKESGTLSIKDIIEQGTATRLRPVLMTAAVASLGFLPMALSHGSGAELQKPLATVVIGGLISATLLTLLVLPCIYFRMHLPRVKNALPILVIGLFASFQTQAQQSIQMSLDSALKIAQTQNLQLNAARLNRESVLYQKRSSSELPKTQLGLLYGQYNGFYKNDNQFTVSQTIPFPGSIAAKSALGKARLDAATTQVAITQNEVNYQIKWLYYQLLGVQQRYTLLLRHDSVIRDLARTTASRFEQGDATLLEKTSTEMRMLELQNMLLNNRAEASVLETQLQAILGTNQPVSVLPTETFVRVLKLQPDTNAFQNNPQLRLLTNQIAIAQHEKSVVVNSTLPDVSIGYLNQSLYGVPLSDEPGVLADANQRFQGISVGLAFPLWFAPELSKMKQLDRLRQASEANIAHQKRTLQSQFTQAVQMYLRTERSLTYYQTKALPNATLIRTQSTQAYQSGEISFAQHLLNMQQSLTIEENYVQTVLEYDKAIIDIEFLTSN
ncbi:MAG: CusA/CzcA family heavy metal efflux RND transporter [Bacteroidia bacterium]|jgi:cobalt-zinc-cadmium resistance protein CzcA|nr:CusA/CzcA family heavy metal efflux RND transporter [Bacteroidia bacterium]